MYRQQSLSFSRKITLRTLVWVILYTISSSKNFAVAQNTSTQELSISDIPPCGFECLFQIVPTSGCSFEDIQCQCSSNKLKQAIGACLLANCTIEDSLDTVHVQADLCHLPNESKSLELVISTSIVMSIIILSVALRVLGKILSKRTSWDDCIIIFALLLTILPCSCVFQMTRAGFGKHLWNLQSNGLKQSLLFFYIAWSTCIIILGLIKISLLLFYLQIFHSPRFRIAAYVIIVGIFINNAIIFFLTIFVCNPVHAFWDRDIKGAKCLDINLLVIVNSGCAMFQDVMILVLPFFSIAKLNMRKTRKLAIGLMLTVGTLGCIATGLRLRTLFGFKLSIDPTWDYVAVTLWTEIEICAGFVCVCLPSIRILLTMILPQRLISLFSHHRLQRNPIPPQNMNPGQQQQKRALSIFHIPTISNGNSFGAGARKSHTRLQHQRLGSTIENQTTMDIHIIAPIDGPQNVATTVPPYLEGPQNVATTAPPYLEVFTSRSGRNTLNPPPQNPRKVCPSCGSYGEFITALPRIGLLDANNSQFNLQRNFRILDAPSSGNNGNNV